MNVATTRARIKSLKPKGIRAMQAGFARAYDGASTGGRVSGWLASGSGPNAVVAANVGDLRRRCRQAVRNNPWAASAVSKLASEAIGSGITPLSKAPDAAFQADSQQLWDDWQAASAVDGLLDVYGLQALIAREFYEVGECFVRVVDWQPGPDGLVPIRLQLIESEQVPTEHSMALSDGNVIRQGVEFDSHDRRVAYHIYARHPLDDVAGVGFNPLVRVPATDILHIFRPLRAGQIRGLPSLAPVLIKMFDLDGYEDAELIRKKVAAMIAGFISPGFDPDSTPLVGTEATDGEGRVAPALQPGSMHVLQPGDEVTFNTPSDVGSNYEGFLRWNLRAVAATANISFEQLTGDLSGVNYSSIRAGLLTQRRLTRMDQEQIFGHQFVSPMWRRVVTAGVMLGHLSVPGFAANPAPWLRMRPMPHGWGSVDAVKDRVAEQMDMRNGTTSRSEIIGDRGRDPDQVDAEIAADNARADELGLIFDSDPRRVSKAGVDHGIDPELLRGE